jgi:hypothetical protein
MTRVTALGILSLSLATAGCSSDGGSPDTLACLRDAELGSQCLQRDELIGDDRLYVIADCEEVGGKLVDACPTDNFIGSCRGASKVKTSQGFVDRRATMHYYDHAMLDSENLAERWRGRCADGDGEWIDATR